MYRNRALDIRHRERSDLALIFFFGLMFDWDKCVVITYELTYEQINYVSYVGVFLLSGLFFFVLLRNLA